MNDDTHSPSEMNLKSVARNAALEPIQTIVWASKSEADVPATFERLFTLIYNEWQQVDWSQYGSALGMDPLDEAVTVGCLTVLCQVIHCSLDKAS
jgi:hypothetical protein